MVGSAKCWKFADAAKAIDAVAARSFAEPVVRENALFP